MKITNNNPELLHKKLYEQTERKFAFSNDSDYNIWRTKLKGKFTELIGMPDTPKTNPEILIESEEEHAEFTEIRFQFESEPDYYVPCHLLLPKRGQKPFPVVVCLQGHNNGMHLSLGRIRYDCDVVAHRSYGLQAISHGYAALVMEQRGFGVCKAVQEPGTKCHIPAMQALMIGRTILGERVFDVSRAITTLSNFPEIDLNRIGCMGNSGGGTVTYYAACLDERIKVAMPSTSVCTYLGTIYSIFHCQCSFIPFMLNWFEMHDLAGLIAPRKLIVIAGREDELFPIEHTEICFATISDIYKKAGYEENCRLIIGEGGHRFYPEEAWPVFKEMSGF